MTLKKIDKNGVERDMTPQEEADHLADMAVVDSLQTTKDKKLNRVRLDANKTILAKWPIWRQLNADSGIYPAAVKDEKDADVAAVIEVSNVAEDAIDAATTNEQVEAVTPVWPVL